MSDTKDELGLKFIAFDGGMIDVLGRNFGQIFQSGDYYYFKPACEFAFNSKQLKEIAKEMEKRERRKK